MKKHYKAIRIAVCVLIVGVSIVGLPSVVYSDTRPGGCDDMIEVLREAGLLEEAIADGTVSPEAAAEAGVTGGGTSEAPSTPAETPSGSGSGESAAPASASSGDTSGTVEEPKKQEKKKTEVVITESEVSGRFVVTTATDLYDTNKKSNKVSSLEAGTIVNVIAETSNGLFKTEDGYYFDKTKCVTADEWEAGWQETARVDATCTEAGSVTYNNSNNTEITKQKKFRLLDMPMR